MRKRYKLLFSIFLSKLLPLLIIGILVYIYRPILFNTITSAGDFPYYWDTYINELTIPSLWNPHWPTGIGGNQAVVLPLKLYFHSFIVLFVQQLHVPWELIERFIFFLVFLILSIYTSYLLTKSWIGALIYTANTWILMVVSGGQMGIALAYAVAPLTLHSFIKLFDLFQQKTTPRSVILHSILASLIFSAVFLFDVRVGYIVVLAIFIYFIFTISSLIKTKLFLQLKTFVVYAVILPVVVTLLLNSYWLLPLLFSGTSLSAIQIQPTLEEVKFFSFATFSNTIGMLHPNWPDNIFGKVGFMKAEFLLLPVLAFASLLFVSGKSQTDTSANRKILFFSSLGLLGIFLAKGANEPFGALYLWAFEAIPGVTMFRDSTKFYILIAFAYAVLIPITLARISDAITILPKAKKGKASLLRKYLPTFLVFGFIGYYVFLLNPVFLGQVKGIFNEHAIPKEYVELKKYLAQEDHFYRTLWIQQRQRFGYYSNTHPAVSAADFLRSTNTKDFISRLKKPEMKTQLQDMAIKYVIIPFDSEGEIFLNDRKYDEKMYQRLYKDIKSIPWLKEQKRFGKIVVFETSDPKDHIWIQRTKGNNAAVTYNRISDTRYSVAIKESKKGDTLIFSEQFDKGWVLRDGSNELISSPYNKVLNSYMLPNNITNAELEYKPQRYLQWGYGVSLAALLLASGALVILMRKQK